MDDLFYIFYLDTFIFHYCHSYV